MRIVAAVMTMWYQSKSSTHVYVYVDCDSPSRLGVYASNAQLSQSDDDPNVRIQRASANAVIVGGTRKKFPWNSFALFPLSHRVRLRRATLPLQLHM